ncbi:MAG: hypothetical protein RMJ36_03390 [Candidatus Calescibacterium sp.]|nr:hypothetical protein [Candidatus Calescibacterium sp.]MDW8132680.1 hypothetical protein [Candidatus Calescibacterium sp.]
MLEKILNILDTVLKVDMVTLILLFVILLLIPFILPVYELIRKKEKNLDIDLLYSRDPAFWGSSYLKLLFCTLSSNLKSIHSFEDLKKIEKDLVLEMEFCFDKGKDKFLITKNLSSCSLCSNKIDFVTINVGSLELKSDHFFSKELVVFGDLYINSSCFFNSLIVIGNLYINSNVKVLNFLHVDGEIYINSETDVQGMIFASQKIFIFSKVYFKRMFSPKIISKYDSDIEREYEIADEDKKIVISGNIKLEGNFIIDSKEKYVIIDGSIVSDRDLYLRGNVWVLNNLFCQGTISLSDGVLVGNIGKTKSVIAKKKIIISGNVKVYGYVYSEGGSIIMP